MSSIVASEQPMAPPPTSAVSPIPSMTRSEWEDFECIAKMCESGEYVRINVASGVRRKAIVAAFKALVEYSKQT